MNAQSKPVVSLVPSFTRETAILKIRAVEDNWNTREPERVARGYTPDCFWRNRSEFLHGRAEIIAFLTRKWAAELDYRLIKELWAFGGSRIDPMLYGADGHGSACCPLRVRVARRVRPMASSVWK